MPYSFRLSCFLLALVLSAATAVSAQTPSCRTAEPPPQDPAHQAFANGDFAQAESLLTPLVAAQPGDANLAALLALALLRQDKLAASQAQLDAALAAHPASAPLLVARAELEWRRGQPWQAAASLDAARAADPCMARIYLLQSRIDRLDSMYARQRADLEKAHELDPDDPDILAAWNRLIPAAQEIEGTLQALATTKDIDPDTKQKALTTVHDTLPLLWEDSETCKGLPTVDSATLPLLPSKMDGKQIDGFRLEVNLPQGPVKLMVDTATSGIYITREIAERNGWKQAAGAPAGTVQAGKITIGPLEFHDCMVGVSDAPFQNKGDGFIGTDMLADYLITIDGPNQKLHLSPLPAQPAPLPADRMRSGALAGFQPVYHRRHYLLVPVEIHGRVRKMLALDSGMRMSSLSSETAHAASDLKMNFTNPLDTRSGPPIQVYRDNFSFDFAGQSMQRPTGSIVSMEPTAIDRNTGFDVGGLIGFDMLGGMILSLDYRDGLIKLETPIQASEAAHGKPEATPAESCPSLADEEIPLNQTLELKVLGMLDSAHLKPGARISGQVVHGLVFPGCTLNEKSIVYGHVITSQRTPNSAEMSLVFDHGDCFGADNKPLALHVIALLPPPDTTRDSLHGSLPTEISGGGRAISSISASTDGYDTLLSEGGNSHTVRPGKVVGSKKLTLFPTGGPGCSASIHSSTSSVQLYTGSELILAISATQPR